MYALSLLCYAASLHHATWCSADTHFTIANHNLLAVFKSGHYVCRELYAMDQTSSESVKQAIDRVAVTHGRIDVLYMNAGKWQISHMPGAALRHTPMLHTYMLHTYMLHT